MSDSISRRDMLTRGTVAAIAVVAANPQAADAVNVHKDEPFRYCLNTSTIRGQDLSLVEQIEIAAKAGYSGIEPWIEHIQKHVNDGGKLSDVKRRIADRGLTVESAIGFANWIVDDDAKRADGLEVLKRDMDLVKQIGGIRIAAPPAGATGSVGMDLLKIAKRYRAALEIGDEIGVVPQVEIWGPSKTLSRLGEAVFVAVEAAHPKACVMPDVYHVYKGGSDISGIRLLHGQAMQVFHMNDYPAQPPRQTINDSHRVYLGDGIAPLGQLFRDLRDIGFTGALSLELFNRDYWAQDALLVAETGLRKMREQVQKALA